MVGYEDTMGGEKEAYESRTLAKILAELTINVRFLAEAQKDLANMVHAQSKYLETPHLKANTDLNLILEKIDNRLNLLEEHRLVTTAASKARVMMIEKVVRYVPFIVTILLAFISVGVVLTIRELPI